MPSCLGQVRLAAVVPLERSGFFFFKNSLARKRAGDCRCSAQETCKVRDHKRADKAKPASDDVKGCTENIQVSSHCAQHYPFG